MCLRRAGRESVQLLLLCEEELCLYRSGRVLPGSGPGPGRAAAAFRDCDGARLECRATAFRGRRAAVCRCAGADVMIPRPMAIPVSRVVEQARAKRVRLETPQFDAHCNKMTCVGGGDVVLLEGDVEMTCRRNGAAMRVTGQRVRVYLNDGTFTVETASEIFTPAVPVLWSPTCRRSMAHHGASFPPAVLPLRMRTPPVSIIPAAVCEMQRQIRHLSRPCRRTDGPRSPRRQNADLVLIARRCCAVSQVGDRCSLVLGVRNDMKPFAANA